MPALEGWLGLSCNSRIDNGSPLVECEGYDRVPVSWHGSPRMDQVQRMAGPTQPEERAIRYAAVFDAPTAGHCLVYFRLLEPFSIVPSELPLMDLMLMFNLDITLALNGTALDGSTSEVCSIERGAMIGRLNNAPVIAGIRLAVHAGTLVARVSLLPAKRAAAAE